MRIDKVEEGMLAKVKAGHDKGRIYVICKVDESYVYLTNGMSRSLDNPKKKKRIHVQMICEKNNMTGIDDLGIRRILKKFDEENGRK